MYAFHHAHDFVLSNPQFTHQNNIHLPGLSGIDILRESSIPEATFDSESRSYAPSCFPGTRLQYIEDITNWATPSAIDDSPLPIYRMAGPAGVGKSAIAQTCAEKIDDRKILGASFFFSIRGCSDHTRFFTSIAYQLSIKFLDYRDILNHKVHIDPTLVGKQLRTQFRELIVEPLRELGEAGKKIGRRAILVDGLDECMNKDAQREIIEIVAASALAHETPFCWAFFSRPEPQIEAAFADPSITSICHATFLPISRDVDEEIELYLRHSLQSVLRRRHIVMSNPWPSEQDMRALVIAADGLFIYAATVVRFVGQIGTRYDPHELLRVVLGSSPPHLLHGPKRPFAELDAFYTLILQRIPSERHSDIQLLCAIAFTRGADTATAAIFLSNMLGYSEVKMRMLCNELPAVVCFQGPRRNSTGLGSASIDTTQSFQHVEPEVVSLLLDDMYDQGGWLSFYHKSFYDFLCDPTRSGSFCVTTQAMRNRIIEHFLQLYMLYAQSYSIQGNSLVHTQSYVETLSWPLHTELGNSYIKARIFESAGGALLDEFFPYDDLDPQLLRRLADIDHRKYLLSQPCIFPEGFCVRGTNFGFRCSIRNVRGTMLCWTSSLDMLSFDIERFQQGIARLEEANVIQRYYPDTTSLEQPLFRSDSDGRALSGLYTRGHGSMGTYWYWYLDPEMKFYREFETIDLAEGERIYQEAEWEILDEEDEENEENEENENEEDEYNHSHVQSAH